MLSRSRWGGCCSRRISGIKCGEARKRKRSGCSAGVLVPGGTWPWPGGRPGGRGPGGRGELCALTLWPRPPIPPPPVLTGKPDYAFTLRLLTRERIPCSFAPPLGSPGDGARPGVRRSPSGEQGLCLCGDPRGPRVDPRRPRSLVTGRSPRSPVRVWRGLGDAAAAQTQRVRPPHALAGGTARGGGAGSRSAPRPVLPCS